MLPAIRKYYFGYSIEQYLKIYLVIRIVRVTKLVCEWNASGLLKALIS